MSSDPQSRPLRLVFWDLFDDPEDVAAWSGISAFIIKGLRDAGHEVVTAGRPFSFLRRALSSLSWHYYTRVHHLHYIPSRDARIIRLFSYVDAIFSRRRLASADAIVTVSTTATALLKTEKPIFVVHDATWGQILELYPYFAPEHQVPRVARAGFELEKGTFTRSNTTLVLTSRWTADRAQSDYALNPEKLFVQPLGANFSPDPPRDAVENAIRARSGEQCRLLFVGREFDRKGGPIAVEIVSKLRELGVPAVLEIVGCEPQDMPAWVTVHGLLKKDNPKQFETLQRLYAMSDFFLLPTRAEAQGIVFNEAAAYGLPAVASDVGGVSGVVRPDWGFLLPLDAPAQDYAEWIAAVFHNRKRYIELANNARNDFEDRLSRSAYTRTLVGIIRSRLVAADTSFSPTHPTSPQEGL